MSRFDPWRLRELAILIDDLIVTLRSGKNPEWASVFAHFGREVELLGPAKTADRDELTRLIRNIRSCLTEKSGLARLVLEGKTADESSELNRRFIHLKARLKNSLDTLQEKLIEFVN
jgi:hypothetical protein